MCNFKKYVTDRKNEFLIMCSRKNSKTQNRLSVEKSDSLLFRGFWKYFQPCVVIIYFFFVKRFDKINYISYIIIIFYTCEKSVTFPFDNVCPF